MNDVLRLNGVVKEPMILPVSSLISSDPAVRRAYNSVLGSISRPFLGALAGTCEFLSRSIIYPDGICSNFALKGQAMALPVWRYPDLTSHVLYLADELVRTTQDVMREESRYLRNHAQARAAIKDIIEMPDMQIDWVIRSVEANQGRPSNTLAKEIPLLAEPGSWAAIVEATVGAFCAKG